MRHCNLDVHKLDVRLKVHGDRSPTAEAPTALLGAGGHGEAYTECYNVKYRLEPEKDDELETLQGCETSIGPL